MNSTCQTCHSEFHVPPSRSNARFCSQDCWQAYHREHGRGRSVEVECGFCGKVFKTYRSRILNDEGKFCSSACRDKAKERKETRICAECGREFIVKQSSKDVCCSWECRCASLRINGGEGNQYYGKAEWRELSNLMRARDGYECTSCGSRKSLQVHHLIRRKSGGIDVADNLITLCTSCHAQAHAFHNVVNKLNIMSQSY